MFFKNKKKKVENNKVDIVAETEKVFDKYYNLILRQQETIEKQQKEIESLKAALRSLEKTNGALELIKRWSEEETQE